MASQYNTQSSRDMQAGLKTYHSMRDSPMASYNDKSWSFTNKESSTLSPKGHLFQQFNDTIPVDIVVQPGVEPFVSRCDGIEACEALSDALNDGLCRNKDELAQQQHDPHHHSAVPATHRGSCSRPLPPRPPRRRPPRPFLPATSATSAMPATNGFEINENWQPDFVYASMTGHRLATSESLQRHMAARPRPAAAAAAANVADDFEHTRRWTQCFPDTRNPCRRLKQQTARARLERYAADAWKQV